MEDKKSIELMEKNAQRLKEYEQGRMSSSSLIINYFKRIAKYISLGNWSYAAYAFKRAFRVAVTKKDDSKDRVAESSLDIHESERLVIYTVLFGNYDDLKEPLYVTPNCDYYILTNQEVKTDSVWKKYPIEKFQEQTKCFSNLEKARFFKLHPHLLFPEYKYSMFIDANLQMVTDMRPVFKQLENNFIEYKYSMFIDANLQMVTDMRPVFKQLENNFIAIHNQPGRDCVYQEATEIIVIGKADKAPVIEQMKAYKKEGFPKHYGLFRTCVVVREHNNEQCIKLMELWWKEINAFTKRDQLSFTYALWKMGLTKNAVSNLGYDPRTNPRFIESVHTSHKLQ